MRRASALSGLRGGGRRGAAWDDAGAALAPLVLALGAVVVLVRYRATVIRTVVVLADHLGRAVTASTTSPPLAPRQPPVSLADRSATGATGLAEVAAPVASHPVGDEGAASEPEPEPEPEPRSTPPPAHEPRGVPDAAAPATAEVEAEATDPDSVPGDGSLVCPDDFPVKGNATSLIYHLPGTSYYAMTKASLCFRSLEAAERAGYRPSKSSPIRSTGPEQGGA